MMPAKRKEINLLAETVRDGLDLTIPIDVEEAVSRLGGTLKGTEALDDKMEACVRKQGERFEILIADSKPETRKRFSVAHEIGHLFLHMGYLINPDVWGNVDEYKDSVYFRYGYGAEEREANEFAAAFLMPEIEFRETVKKHTADGRCSIESVAAEFRTSKDAALTRGVMLGIFNSEQA